MRENTFDQHVIHFFGQNNQKNQTAVETNPPQAYDSWEIANLGTKSLSAQ